MTGFLIFWESLVKLLDLPAYLVPPPSSVLLLLYVDFSSFQRHLSVTAIEAGAGFLLGTAVASMLALGMFRFDLLKRSIMPYCAAFQAVPIVAVAPLLIIWFGSGIQSKIIMAAVISFFPTLAVIITSFEEANPEAQLLFRMYRADYPTLVRRLLLPASLPAITTGLKVSAGLAVVGAIVAEMTGADRGIGFLILTSSYRMETVRLFAAIIIASFLGLVAYSLPGLLRLLLPHYWVASREKK
jgi:ABC-type nitrate/sulfonate/bicarbonate transport system permease component